MDGDDNKGMDVSVLISQQESLVDLSQEEKNLIQDMGIFELSTAAGREFFDVCSQNGMEGFQSTWKNNYSSNAIKRHTVSTVSDIGAVRTSAHADNPQTSKLQKNN